MNKLKTDAGRNDRLVLVKRILFIAALVVYGIACTYLYYMQAGQDGVTNVQYFESDLPAHIQMAFDGWGYSVTAIVYRLLGLLPGWRLTIALFLALCMIGTIILTYTGVKKYAGEASEGIALISAFAMPFFLSFVHWQRYIGYQSGSVWHNSTYNVMKVCAVATLIMYFKIASKMKDNFKAGELVAFSLLLALTTAVKTSFTLVFAPAALIIIFADMSQKVSLKKVLAMATTVVPSLVVMLLQEVILFGESTGNGIEIDFGYTVFQRAEKPQFTMILSALFPVMIFIFNIVPVVKETISKLKKKEGLPHRAFWLSWIMWFFGALQLLFLKETGERAAAGNFAWGYNFCLFVLFVVSMVYFLKNIKEKKYIFTSNAVRIVYIVAGGGILFYHTYCGIYFFLNLLEGTTYFM